MPVHPPAPLEPACQPTPVQEGSPGVSLTHPPPSLSQTNSVQVLLFLPLKTHLETISSALFWSSPHLLA